MDELHLDNLPLGQRAKIGAPTALSPDVHRAMEMGLVPGTTVTRLRSAPFGGVVEIQLGSSRLCLAVTVAACFPVTVVGAY